MPENDIITVLFSVAPFSSAMDLILFFHPLSHKLAVPSAPQEVILLYEPETSPVKTTLLVPRHSVPSGMTAAGDSLALQKSILGQSPCQFSIQEVVGIVSNLTCATLPHCHIASSITPESLSQCFIVVASLFLLSEQCRCLHALLFIPTEVVHRSGGCRIQ